MNDGQPWKPIPEPDNRYVDDENLHDIITEWIKSYVELADTKQYDIVASFAMASWLADNFRAVPYLYAVGPYGSGKSTLLEVLNEICYKSVKASSMTVAALAEFMDRHHPTLLIDEAQVYNRKALSELHAIVDAGYRRESPRFKIVGGEAKGYDVFGFKAFASKEYPWDSLASRCLILNMTEKNNELEETLTEEFDRRGSVVRAYLHAYQLKHRLEKRAQEPSPEVRAKLNGTIHNSRVRELGSPLLVVTPTKARENVLSYLKDMEDQNRSERKTSEESYYVEALRGLESELELYKGTVHENKIPTSFFRSRLKNLMKEEGMVTPSAKAISQKLKVLGLRIIRASNGTWILWDQSVIDGLTKRYYRS